MCPWSLDTRSISFGSSVSLSTISCATLKATGITVDGSSGSAALARRIRCARPWRRATISAAVFFRGNSPKYSSMYWISSAPCSSSYWVIRYSTLEIGDFTVESAGFDGGSLMSADRATAILARFSATSQTFAAKLRALPPGVAEAHADTDSWSPAQIGCHVALSNHWIADVLTGSSAAERIRVNGADGFNPASLPPTEESFPSL